MNITIQAITVDSVLITWSPVNKCISNYTVTLVDELDTQRTTSNNSIVYDTLQQGNMYTFRVKGTDTAGRTGSDSDGVSITMDGRVVVYSVQCSNVCYSSID